MNKLLRDECMEGEWINASNEPAKINTLEITVRIKNVYGNTTIYPVCEKAQIFANMVGQKTLTQRDIDNIKSLGYVVNVASGITSL